MTRHDSPLPFPDSDPRPNTTPPRRPRICSTSWRCTATGRDRTSPIRGRCPKPTPSRAISARSPKRSKPCSPAPASRTIAADLFWAFVNLFHRKAERIERELDANEQAQRTSQREQDGSEVKSVELERLTAQGISLIERRNAFEFCRDHAAEPVRGSRPARCGGPRAGSMVNHRTLTAAMIDSRDFLAARRRADTEILAPAGTAHRLHRRHRLQRPRPHLGRARQGPRQASRHGAAARRQPEGRRAHRRLLGRQSQGRRRSPSSRDWTRHAKAAPFKRNDRCSRRCRSASSSSPAPASPPISPTRPRPAASRSGASASRPPPARVAAPSAACPACFFRRALSRGPVQRRRNARLRCVLAACGTRLPSLDPVAGAPARDKGARQRRVEKVDREPHR